MHASNLGGECVAQMSIYLNTHNILTVNAKTMRLTMDNCNVNVFFDCTAIRQEMSVGDHPPPNDTLDKLCSSIFSDNSSPRNNSTIPAIQTPITPLMHPMSAPPMMNATTPRTEQHFVYPQSPMESTSTKGAKRPRVPRAPRIDPVTGEQIVGRKRRKPQVKKEADDTVSNDQQWSSQSSIMQVDSETKSMSSLIICLDPTT
jgi:hypothetical protein